jgi:hypothetical protein
LLHGVYPAVVVADEEPLGVTYVMVPVPEEHVLTVLRYVVELGSSTPDRTPPGWDDDAVRRLYLDSDETTRSLLAFLAQPDVAGTQVRPKDVSTALGVEPQQLPGVVGPLNKRARKAGHEPPIQSTLVSERRPDGQVVRRRIFRMREDVAGMVRAAQAEASGG